MVRKQNKRIAVVIKPDWGARLCPRRILWSRTSASPGQDPCKQLTRHKTTLWSPHGHPGQQQVWSLTHFHFGCFHKANGVLEFIWSDTWRLPFLFVVISLSKCIFIAERNPINHLGQSIINSSNKKQTEKKLCKCLHLVLVKGWEETQDEVVGEGRGHEGPDGGQVDPLWGVGVGQGPEPLLQINDLALIKVGHPGKGLGTPNPVVITNTIS